MKIKLKPLLFTIFLAATLTGCWANRVMEDRSQPFERPPDGTKYPPYYILGWKDGCQTGAASSADNVYKYQRVFVQDWRLAQDDVYHDGWSRAYDYCRKYFLQQDTSSGYTLR